jgi:hypothetical protein
MNGGEFPLPPLALIGLHVPFARADAWAIRNARRAKS